MKSDAELAASAIGADQINQSAFGLTISAPGAAASGGDEGVAAKATDGKLMRPLGDVTPDGKVVVPSGGGGSTEITPENLVEKSLRAEGAFAKSVQQDAAARSQQIFSAMASSQSWRAAAQPATRKSQSSGREM